MVVHHIEYCYDPYKDLMWVSFTDLDMSCGYGIPVDRRTDVIELVDMILSGEYKQWLEWF